MTTKAQADELMLPDTLTPIYVLRELANWIEHRTGGDEPRDVARIVLAREMANDLDELSTRLAATLEVKKAQIHGEAVNARHIDLERIGADELIGANVPNDPDLGTIAPYNVPVAKASAQPVEDHQCTSLDFNQSTHTGILKVRCDLGRCTTIDLSRLKQLTADPQEVLADIALRVASEHGLNMGELFEKMRRHSLGGLQTITMGTSSLPTPRQG